MLQSYLPAIVFLVLGVAVGGAFTVLNTLFGPKHSGRVRETHDDPYECGLPSEIRQGFRFGISFYLIAMLFILFDIEVVFLYPVGVLVHATKSVFVLSEILVFVALLLVALVFVWRRGALDWK